LAIVEPVELSLDECPKGRYLSLVRQPLVVLASIPENKINEQGAQPMAISLVLHRISD
jgi:hypothetical protein